MNLIGNKVILRAMEFEDMEMYRCMANDTEIEWLVGGWSFPISKIEQNQWYDRVISDKKNLRFTIVDKIDNKPIGMVNLVNIDWKNRSAFHGIKLSSDTPSGKGYGKDSVMTIMKYAFEELQLNRLDGAWTEYNTASINLYKKCGWKIEGTKEKAVFKRGKYYNKHFGGILVEDYYKIKSDMNR